MIFLFVLICEFVLLNIYKATTKCALESIARFSLPAHHSEHKRNPNTIFRIHFIFNHNRVQHLKLIGPHNFVPKSLHIQQRKHFLALLPIITILIISLVFMAFLNTLNKLIHT